jgi:26S proteasome regulatory subunit N6
MPEPTTKRLEEAKAISSKEPAKAEQTYKYVLSQGPGSTEAASRDYEAALIGLGELYRDGKRSKELADLIKTSRDSFSSFAKAKTAKLGKYSLRIVLKYMA